METLFHHFLKYPNNEVGFYIPFRSIPSRSIPLRSIMFHQSICKHEYANLLPSGVARTLA